MGVEGKLWGCDCVRVCVYLHCGWLGVECLGADVCIYKGPSAIYELLLLLYH